MATFKGTRVCVLAALAGWMALAGQVQGALIVGNLTSPFGSTEDSPNTDVLIASPITLDASFVPRELESVTLRLGSNTGVTAGVSLWSQSGDRPGTQLVDLGTLEIPASSMADHVFTPLSSFVLQAESTYWVVLRKVSGPGAFQWGLTFDRVIDAGSDPAADIPEGVSAGSGNNGASWSRFTTPWEHMFAVHGVPEPATLSVLGLGALGILRRRRAGN